MMILWVLSASIVCMVRSLGDHIIGTQQLCGIPLVAKLAKVLLANLLLEISRKSLIKEKINYYFFIQIKKHLLFYITKDSNKSWMLSHFKVKKQEDKTYKNSIVQRTCNKPKLRHLFSEILKLRMRTWCLIYKFRDLMVSSQWMPS